MTVEVSPNASVKLDANGNGQVSIGPPSGTVWRLRLANVSTTGTVKQPQCFLYRGSTSGPIEQIDSTYLGNSASSGKVAGAPFYQGQVLWAKWTGGDANAIATLQAYGQQGTRGEQGFFDLTAVGEGFPLNVATSFQAGNTVVINSSGLFEYSGIPASGNLVASVSPAGGTDPYGNTFLTGTVTYLTVGGQAYAIAIGQPNTQTVPAVFFQNQTTSQFVQPYVGAGQPASGTQLVLGSGAATNVASESAIIMEDSVNSGVTNGEILLNAGEVVIGNSGLVTYTDSNSTLNIATGGSLDVAAGSGPFIGGEGWHNLSAASGTTGLLSGGITIRVKLLPWNAVWMDIEFSYTSAGGTTFTFGSLPSASYYPNVQRHFPAETTGNISTTTIGVPRVFVPTSGAVQVVVPAMSASSTYTIAGSVIYPTN